MAFCPLLIILGHLLSFINKDRYFHQVNKDGIINTYFVKNGWFWTTLTLGWCLYRYYITSYSHLRSKLRVKRVAKRYLILTLWWYVFTQGLIPLMSWPPLMDLVFLWTGGQCHYNIWDEDGVVNPLFHDHNEKRVKRTFRILSRLFSSSKKQQVKEAMWNQSLSCIHGENHTECNEDVNKYIRQYVSTQLGHELSTSQECRRYGGHWTGGHDPSGHIFLLTLMIMLLLGELPHFINTERLDNDDKEKKKSVSWWLKPLKFCFWDEPLCLIIGFILLWSWSLVVTTASCFHTVLEQLTGLLAAYVVVFWCY